MQNRPSSTNEAALGAFHPRYTTPRAAGGTTKQRYGVRYTTAAYLR
jgi:hypothetical protein